MAHSSASSSSSSRNWVYDVFPSFSGEDVRVTFLSHFLKELDRKLIIAFKDNEIERSRSLDSELKQAIKNSRVAVVVFSKNYASSSWCLNELLEIVKCKEEFGQLVIPVFYGLDPSHVRKQTGDFGKIFAKTCENNRTKEEVEILWRKALTDVANILGYHSVNWDNEATMIEAIANDVLDKLLLTPSMGFENFVGIEDHIARMSELLNLEYEEVRMVGIWGSSGIGKTTIARALYSRLNRHFQCSVFIDSHFVSKSMKVCRMSNMDDDYSMKLHLQQNFLSKILGQKDIKIGHLGVIQERLKQQKVLILLDDLDDLMVLDALAGQTNWFGNGSRIIVVTKDKHLLRAYGIDHIYKVCLPSEELALEMFCQSAFRQNYPPDGFKEFASEVVLGAGCLPLGLNIFGSYLRGKEKKDWKDILLRFRNGLDGKIETTLRVSYDLLSNKDQALFRHIACLFNGEKVKNIKLLLADSNLDINIGLKYLVDKYLVQVREDTVEMHSLLQEMGKGIVRAQSNEPGEREFLVDSNDICDLLEDNTGTNRVLGISLDMDEIDELHVHENAFEGMRYLCFLKMYNTKKRGQKKEVRWHLPENFNYLPSKLRLLRLDGYPMKSLPSNFHTQNLIKLKMPGSKLERLWEGVHPLQRLKIMDLRGSRNLKEIPDLSKASNLETLRLNNCSSLVELPSSIQCLHKLEELDMQFCENLQILPSGINLQSLKRLNLKGCSRLRSFPDISTNISELILNESGIEGIPCTLCLKNLTELSMEKMMSDKIWEGVQPLTPLMAMFPYLTRLRLSDISSLVELPSSFQNFQELEYLWITDCINLETLPADINLESLGWLDLSGCTRLKSFPNISTNISDLDLSETGIEEVPRWIENFSRLERLHMVGCHSLLRVSLNISKLKHLDVVDFSDCSALIKASLNDSLPPDDASSSLPNNYIPLVKLHFINCFHLDQKDLLEQQSVFLLLNLLGEEVPSYFTHQTTKTSSLTIPLLQSTLSEEFFIFRGCLVVDFLSQPSFHQIQVYIDINCRFEDRFGNHFDSTYQLHSDLVSKKGSHLVIFDCCIPLNKDNAPPCKLNYDHVDIQFHMSRANSKSRGKSALKLKGCGIRLLGDALPPVCESDIGKEVNLEDYETEYNKECGDQAVKKAFSRKWLYDVFLSFSEADIRVTFLSHLLKELGQKSITAFNDHGMERSRPLDPNVKQAIKDSRIGVVVFSRRYASYSWCLDELLEILKCKEETGRILIPVFYGVDPSHVKKQTGDFGKFFKETCEDKTEEVKIRWREALTNVADISGCHSVNWGNEATMIEEIANEILDKLHSTPSKNLTPSKEQIKMSQDHDTYESTPKELKWVNNETDGTFWDSKSNVNVKEGDSFRGEVSFAEISTSHSIENKIVDPMKVENKPGQVSRSSPMVTYEGHMPQHQVFINFWGEEVRFSLISHLITAFSKERINISVGYEKRCEDLGRTFQSIEDSKIALVIFSSRYTESKWCLEELVKIKKRMDEGKLEIIPIIYNVELSQVKQLEGDFGVKLWNLWRIDRDPRIIKWKYALESVAAKISSSLNEHRSESEFVTFVVKKVKENIPLREGENLSIVPSTGREKTCKLFKEKGEKLGSFLNNCPLFGLEQRMKQLEQKLEFDSKETRIIGVVGMAGIGKTTLAKLLHEKWNCKFVRCAPLLGIRKKSEIYTPQWLRKTLFEVLLGGKFGVIDDKTTHESLEDRLVQTKVLIVLDDVSNKKQLKFLLGNLNWIKKGSKIVITSRDKSLIERFVQDTYVVPPLNYGDALQLFSYHAFGGQVFHASITSMKLYREFVDCAGGNPLVIKLLGKQFHGRDEAKWEMRGDDLTDLGMVILDMFRLTCVELSEKQRDVFLDIACFFRSEDDYFVRSLLGSGDHDAIDAKSQVRNLTQKGMVAIFGCRVEMHGLLYMFGKIFSSQVFIEENGGKSRLWTTREIVDALINKKDTKSTRGIFLDMSEVTKGMVMHRLTFIDMLDLRYLKIYDSCCPWPCKASCNLHFPDGIEFPLQKVRYLHWEKFPLEELPPDFKANNLVDLRLPYSRIKRVWEDVKDTPRLKWVDLSHSSDLLNLSALSNAESLQRLNLEGCTSLVELPFVLQNMKSLVYLNMRGCIRLSSLPKVNLISLKTLILSDCSNLEEFQVISKSLEALHLDGTAIKELPPSIGNLHRLVIFNMKNCKLLECLPNSLGQLKFLEELILSGCLRLKNLPDVRQSLKHVQILLLDGTGLKEMPQISCFTELKGQSSIDMLLQPSRSYLSEWPRGVYVSSLRRLCLSGSDFVSLQNDIGELYNLTWLDVKECKQLRSVPMLPPRLQYFDAHGCDSLEKVANPLALLKHMEPTHAIFNFSNCNKLDQEAHDSIIYYTRQRSQLILGALSRHSEAFAFEASTGTCFPGREVPPWFSDRASGSFLEPKLPPYWCDDMFTGIALSAVIRFPANQNQQNHLLVKCNCNFRFSCTIGGWSKPGNSIQSSHVFIGYASRLAVSKHGGYDEKICFCTKCSLEFQVTDGMKNVEGCEVLQCGFSLVYATDEAEGISWDAKIVVIPKRVNSVPVEENITLWKSKDILEKLTKMEKQEENEANNVRCISLDMVEVTQSIAMERLTFINMRNLRYLKIYESCCPQKVKSDCKLQFPDGFNFPLEEVQYFHWLKFPLEELPPDFKPKNLVDLRLPYSNIERLWKGVKDTPRLKWVDLSHSSKLLNLSGLAKAESLQRLNLEGCTNLNELPCEIQNMKSLIYLNMKGCIHLRSLRKMNLISLKTLILSDCSNLKEFQVISKSLEVLHLDGTSIKGLPPAIQKLQRLVLLNLKNCKMLEYLPNCLGKLKVLEELILSGCSRIKNLPDVRHTMRHVQILLFDGTGVDEIPNLSCFIGSEGLTYRSPSEWPSGVNRVSSLRRLCLRGHDFVSLHNDIGQLYNLTWLDLKLCKKLTSVPLLPPRLLYFDAHGCDSLERVANPFALQILTEQIHATFNFSNCYKLNQDAIDSIISYTRWKSQLILDALSRYNGGFPLEASMKTCFPGWEVPAWFSYRAYGSLLEPKLPPHWCDNRITGIALCAVILFNGSQNQHNHLSVKCNCELKNVDGSRIRFSCTVGGWSEPHDTIESSHVFIGYASKLDIKNLCEGDEEGCIETEASFKFEVTDGTKELKGCEVIKCGFSLLYASDELQVISGEHETTADTSQDTASSSLVQDFFGYIFLAFSSVIVFAILSICVIVLAPQYYLRFSDFCWPLLARILFFVAFGLYLKHVTRREKQS